MKITLANLSHFLEQLAENSNSVYWLSTPDFKHIAYLSPAFETIWGRAREELYNDPEKWLSYLHPEDGTNRHPIQAMAEKVTKEGQKARFCETYRIVRPDGAIRWIVDRGFPVFDSQGHCHGVTGVAIDISQEKRYEEQLRRANQAKSELLANLSHDVRTPIAGILGLTQELIDADPKTLRKKIKQDGQSIFKAANALLNLFNDILAAVEVDLRKEETFHLPSLIEQQIKLLQPAAKQKKLKLSWHIDQQVPVYVSGLRHHLERCLLSLLSNALKFTEAGFVSIHVEQERGEITIKIQDSGIGIPSEQFASIFEPFSRLTPAYQGRYPGAGLGLYRVKHDAVEMGASITVASEVGKGSCFTLRLGLTQIAPSTPSPAL